MTKQPRAGKLDKYRKRPARMRPQTLFALAAPSDAAGMHLGPKGALLAGAALIALVAVAIAVT